MKVIWLVSPYIVPGRETRQETIARHLTEAGYKVYVITAVTDGYKDFHGEPYMEKKINDVNYLLIMQEVVTLSGVKRAMAQIIFQQKVIRFGKKIELPELIIGNFAGVFGNGVFYFQRKYGSKIMLDILDFWPEGLVETGHLRKKSFITKYLYDREYKSYVKADSVFFSMPGGREYIVDKKWDVGQGGKVVLDKIHYMNNAIELKKVDENREKYDWEDEDLESNKFKIGYIGTIGIPNEIELLVEAARLAKRHGYDSLLFLIYGTGSQLKSVKKLAEDYQLNNIKFKGSLDKKYAPSTIGKCDIAVLNFREIHSLKYGLSNNKFFVYCASGMPVLSSVHPGYSIIEEKKCGIIVEHTAEAILKGILRFQNMDSDEFNRYKINARKVAEEYDYDKLLIELDKEVVRLIG